MSAYDDRRGGAHISYPPPGEPVRMVPASELRELRAKASAFDVLYEHSNDNVCAACGEDERKLADMAMLRAYAAYDAGEAAAERHEPVAVVLQAGETLSSAMARHARCPATGELFCTCSAHATKASE